MFIKIPNKNGAKIRINIQHIVSYLETVVLETRHTKIVLVNEIFESPLTVLEIDQLVGVSSDSPRAEIDGVVVSKALGEDVR